MTKINFSQEQISEIIDLYVNKKESFSKIAKHFNVSPTPIKRILKENNIPSKNLGEYQRIDLKGMRFGKLIVIDIDPDFKPQSGRHLKWVCKCDCGKTKIVQSNHLKDGSTQACSPGCNHRIEEGTIFGKLKVLKMIDKRDKNSGSIIYECQCECGNIIEVCSTELRANRKTSCKKCNESKGEIEIEKILNENEIDYIKEFMFQDCVNPETNRCLRFDFYLPKYNCCIEYDGIQHYIEVEYWGGKEGFEKRKKLDSIKNEYCKKNNILLTRIPYWEKNNITLNLLMEGLNEDKGNTM